MAPEFEKKQLSFFSSLLCFAEQWDPQEGTVSCIKGGRGSGKVWATAFNDKSVKVFALGVNKAVLDLGRLDSVGTGLAFNPSEEVLAGGDTSGNVTLWSLQQGKVARTLENGAKTVTEIAFHPSGSFVAVAGHDLTTRVWDLREKKCIQTYSAHEKTTAMSFSPGAGAYIVSGGNSGLSKVWDVRAGKMLATLKKHKGSVNDIVFHPTEKILASGGDDGVVHFWNAEDYSKIASSSTFKEAVKSVSFSSSALLAVSDSNLRVMGWNPYTMIDSVASMTWGPVQDAFLRKERLFVSSFSKNGNSPNLTILDLSVGIKPFAESNAENVAPLEAKKPDAAPPAAVEEKKKEEAAEEKKIITSAPVSAPVTAPTVAPVVVDKPEPVPVREKPRKEKKPESSSRRGGSSRSQQEQPSGSRRRQRDATKPIEQVVPSSQVGIVPIDRQVALGLKAEDFRKETKDSSASDSSMIQLCMRDHDNLCAALISRKTHVIAIRSMWNKTDIWKAISQLKEAKELSVVFDILGNLSSQQISIIPLELLNVVLLESQCLIQSEYEDYAVLGCTLLRSMCKVFGSTIKSTRDKSSEARNDSVFAERLEIVKIIWETLSKCSLQLRENLACGGRVGSSSREVLALFRRLGL